MYKHMGEHLFSLQVSLFGIQMCGFRKCIDPYFVKLRNKSRFIDQVGIVGDYVRVNKHAVDKYGDF